MKLKSVLASFCVLVGAIATTTLAVSSPVSAAADDPTVAWTTTNNSNVSGVFTIAASAAPSPTGTATIKKWCLTINGVAATTDSALNDSYDSRVGYYGTFDSSTGCWTNSNTNLTTAQFEFNSTAWANGSVTYQVTVTDTSNRTATSNTLTVNYTNTAPTVAWTTTNNSNVSGVFTIAASAAPSPTGTATIKKWCLTINGVAATTDSALNDSYDSRVGYYGTFDSSTGCWTNSNTNLTTAQFEFNSTAWANGSVTYQVTVTDTSNRTATSNTLTVNYTNTAPTVAWTTTNNSNVSGVFTIAASAAPSPTGTATIKKWCLTINGVAATTDSALNDSYDSRVGYYGTFDSSTGCWTNSNTNLTTAQFEFNSTAWANGSVTYQVTVTDTSNRTATSNTLTINKVTAPSPPVATSTTPAVAWTTTNNSNVSGIFTVSASASPSTSPTATIKKWCLTINGVAATTNSAKSSSMVYSYGSFNADTGCWTDAYNVGLTTAKFGFDSTAWANGSVTYQVTVTDTSNRTATSNTLTVNYNNAPPTVDWTTTNNSNVSGIFTVSASASSSPTGTATIKKWCLTINGVAATTNSAKSSSMVYSYGSFNADTGCWTDAYNVGLTTAKFGFDSTAWANGSVTYQVTVTDTSNRTATSNTLTVNYNNAPPTVDWTTTNNSNVSGIFTVSASASSSPTGTATIKKWCLTINGVAATTNSAKSSSMVYSYGSFNADTGCWTDAYNVGLTTAKFGFDSTAWANGSVTYQVTVTDTSNRTATSNTLTVNYNNAPPTVDWTTTNNSNVSGIFTVSASASSSPTGTATIKKWCLTINGVAATTNSAKSSSMVYSYGSFNADTGCWTDAYNVGLTTAKFGFDSTAWANGSVTYQVTVTDTSNRTATSTGLVVTTTNPQPTASLSGVGGGVSVQSTSGITASLYHPGADSIRTWCFRVSNGPCISGTSQSNGTWRTNGILSLDVSTWVNGSYSLSASAVDSVGRTITASPQTFVVNNPPASGTAPRISHKAPAWNSKTTTAYVRSTLNYANSATIYWGTSTKKMKSTRTSVSNGDETFSVSGLKPNTVYYFKIMVSGTNGSSTTGVVKSKTGKIPPKPKPTPSYSGGGGSTRPSYGSSIYAGVNLEDYQDYYGYRPATFDCTGQGRMNLWSSNWWIVGIRNGSFAISKSPYSCR